MAQEQDGLRIWWKHFLDLLLLSLVIVESYFFALQPQLRYLMQLMLEQDGTLNSFINQEELLQ
jgi:hypothetical protein